MSSSFLQIQNLKTHFPVERGIIFKKHVGTVRAVDGISLDLQKGEILGLVGESGCGKSTLGRTILRLIPATEGTVILAGKNLMNYSGDDLRNARKDFQMVFQDPYASLNPRMTVFDTLAEAIQQHHEVSQDQIAQEVGEVMERVGLAPRLMQKYPHEFSGGQRQRIAIARALAVKPQMIVADEPVSALDVSIQAQIINLLHKLSKEMQLTLLFISHDLSVVKHIADRIAVMYLGKIVELGPAVEVFERPLHPYTQALVSAVPKPDPTSRHAQTRMVLRGDPPSPFNPPQGCPFHTRCPFVIEACKEQLPPLVEYKPHHRVACIRVGEIGAMPQKV